MTLAELTALMSKVGREKPDLMKSREVALFIEACIERQKVVELTPISPTTIAASR